MTQQIKPTIMVSNEEEAIIHKNVEWMFQFDNGEPILLCTPLDDTKKLVIEIKNTSTSNICFYDANGNTFKIFAREKQTNNMAQTSVEWIYNELVVFMTGNSDFESAEELLKHCKAMHKVEIKTAFDNGMNCSADYFEAQSKTSEAENYYNETLKK